MEYLGFPGGSDGKESACNAGDPGSVPELGRSPGEGNGNSLQYSCLENSVDRGAWWARVIKSRTQLKQHTFTVTVLLGTILSVSSGTNAVGYLPRS